MCARGALAPETTNKSQNFKTSLHNFNKSILENYLGLYFYCNHLIYNELVIQYNMFVILLLLCLEYFILQRAGFISLGLQLINSIPIVILFIESGYLCN